MTLYINSVKSSSMQSAGTMMLEQINLAAVAITEIPSPKLEVGGRQVKSHTQWKKTGKFVYSRIKSKTTGEFKVTKMPTYANPSKPGQVRVQKKKADGTKYFATFKEVAHH